MYYNQLLNILLNKIPDILLSVFIFIVFFIIAKIFERLVIKVLNKKNTKIAISKVIDINLRYVTIETDETRALVPNSVSVSKIVVVHKV